MYRLANLIRGGLGLLATIALAALLSGCILSSDDLLVSEGEAATPLPGPFAMVRYEEDGAGYKRSDEGPPGEFALEGKGYVSSDGAMTAYFVPLETDTYLVALSSPDGNMYGFATYRDNVLDLDIVLGDVEGNADLKAIPSVEIADGGVKLTDRAALDAVVALHQEGKLEMVPVIAYIGADASADFPPKLTPNGDGWTAN